MHAGRIVARVLDGASLSLTGLALRTARPTALRHRVKCVDRLMSTTRKDPAEISVMTLARRLISHPVLLRQLGDPWQHLLTLREQVANAIRYAAKSV